jgi:hypothetical protein
MLIFLSGWVVSFHEKSVPLALSVSRQGSA